MPTLETPLARPPTLKAEKVAYWYFRLNGFFLIENFVLHPGRRGSQLTDADLLVVRFPDRAEFVFDHQTPMRDDEDTLSLSSGRIEMAVVEVKGANQLCALNDTWTVQERQNVHRVLAVIGCVPHYLIPEVAARIYEQGSAEHANIRIRLVSVGRTENPDLAECFPRALQITWPRILGFVWDRFTLYANQKSQVDQWDAQGRLLRSLALGREREDFISEVLSRLV